MGIKAPAATLSVPLPEAIEPSGHGSPLRLSFEKMENSTLIIASPHASGTTSSSTKGVDKDALQDLVRLLSEALERISAQHGTQAGQPVRDLIFELRDLSAMEKPNPSWVRQTLDSLKGAGGGLLGELAKPHVMALIAQLGFQLGS